MTLQQLIDELSAATDGAAEDTSFRNKWALFPGITTTRVTYIKRTSNTIEASQILVYVEDLDGPSEAAYYEKDRIPAPLIEAARVVVIPNATPEEIKANLDTIFPSEDFPKYWDIQIQGGEEAGTIIGTFYDSATDTVSTRAYRIMRDEKGIFSKFLIKG